MEDGEAWTLLRELQASTTSRMAQRLAGTDNDIEVCNTHDYPLEEIAVPTLVVQGTKDPLVPFEQNGKQFAARVPGAQLLALEGGEHAAIFSHRREARDRVTDFLRRVAPAEVAAPA
jgi:pimeloyl-ACP methyl ester carboxylesterase